MRSRIPRFLAPTVAAVSCLTLSVAPALAAGASVGLKATGSKAGLSSIGGGSYQSFVTRIISAVLGLVGVIFMVLIIYAGFLWMTAAGNEERIKKAKSIFVNAVIGLVVTFMSYYITQTIYSFYSGQSTPAQTQTTQTGGGGSGG